MAYTISDWFRDNAQVRVRVPAPPGYGKTWWEGWVPYSFFDEGAMSPDWMQNRTQEGVEARDFIANISAFEEH